MPRLKRVVRRAKVDGVVGALAGSVFLVELPKAGELALGVSLGDPRSSVGGARVVGEELEAAGLPARLRGSTRA